MCYEMSVWRNMLGVVLRLLRCNTSRSVGAYDIAICVFSSTWKNPCYKVSILLLHQIVNACV